MPDAAMYKFEHPTSGVEIKTTSAGVGDNADQSVNEALRAGWVLLSATVAPATDRNSASAIIYMFQRRVQN